MLTAILQGAGLGFPAAATPGPLQAFLLAETARRGWRRTLPAALAPLLSDGPIIAATLLLLSRLAEPVLATLQLAGGIFILYLARGAWRAFRTASSGPRGAAPTTGTLWQAAVMNLLNPIPWIFWLTLGSRLLLENWRRAPAHGVAYLAAFYGALTGVFALFILLFGLAERLGPRVSRLLIGLGALALLYFGLYQIAGGLGRLF